MKDSTKKYLGILGLLTVTIIWGGGFVASDIALATLTPFQIMFIRFFIAAVIMTALGKDSIKSVTREEIKCGAMLGSALFGGFALQIIALQYTTPSKNAFLTATNVVIVPFIALVIYKKKIPVKSLVGAGMAKQLIYTARNIKADEAYRIGLVNAVYPLEELLPAAKKMASIIAANAPIAVRNCKKAINDGLQVDMDQAIVVEEKLFGDCFETEDQKAGMGNFLEKDKEKKLKVVPFQNK